MIDSSEDPNGNRVEYFYRQDGQQIYLETIRYGLHATEPSGSFNVRFQYSSDRPDPFVDCRPRFASTNRLRLQDISVFLLDRRIRHWQFTYHTNAPVSLLASVTMFGDERSETNSLAQANRDFLPPTNFDYTRSTVGTSWRLATNYLGFRADFNAGEAEFVDLNHDGLPDILLDEPSEGRFYSSVNPGGNRAWPALKAFASQVFYPPLGRPTTRLVDLSGDGRSKLLVKDEGADGLAFYFRNFQSATELGNDIDFRFPAHFPLDDPNVRFIDINGDKSMDLMAADGDAFAFMVNGQSNGRGQPNWFLANAPRPPGNLFIRFSEGWQLADVNGDRLLDLVRPGQSDIGTEVCLNLGWGNFAPVLVMEGGPSRQEVSDADRAKLQLADINQDGLADLVFVDSGRVRVWLNENSRQWLTPILIEGLVIPDLNSDQVAVRFADINGNGSTDIVWIDHRRLDLRYLELQPAGKAWLLNRVTTTLGRSIDVTYRSSVDFMVEAGETTNKWTSVAPFPVPVVSQIVEGDGLGNQYTNQFTYRNPYYDGLEREFRGFEQAVKRELGDDSQGAPSLFTRLTFDTGATNESLKGKPLRIETGTEAGGVFYRQTNEWLPRELALPRAAGETRSITFAFERRKLTQYVELGSEEDAITVEEEFDYDDFGNLVHQADYGRVENGNRLAWGDERVIARKFSAQFPSGTNLWLLDRLVEEEIRDGRSKVFARSQRFYDDERFLGSNLGSLSKGNVTMVRDWIDITNNLFRASVRNQYDRYGNITKILDPLAVTARLDLGHTRSLQYDDLIHTHPVAETIYTGNPEAISAGVREPSLRMRAEYDFGLGVITSATDFNTNSTRFQYDTFGRLASIIKPMDSTNHPTAEFRYVLQDQAAAAAGHTVNWTETRLREEAEQPGTFDSRTFFDGLGRKFMTRTESETNGVVVVTDATLFNQRRSQWKAILPYFQNGSLDFAPIIATNTFVEHQYDALGRSSRTFQPLTDGEPDRPFSETLYAPLARFVKDEEQTKPNGQRNGAGMRYVEDGLMDKDGKGRLRIVEEIVKISDDGLAIPNPAVWPTSYHYDVLDNFLGYTDSQNNEKEFRYDALRRKIFMDDPDRGHMTWIYDQASNLKETIDAKGQRITYTYDGANRLLTEDYLNGKAKPLWRRPTLSSLFSTNFSVLYHYDLPFGHLDLGDTSYGTARNTAGKLAWVEDLSGEEHTSYDARGREEWVVKRISDPILDKHYGAHPLHLVSYKTGFEYDSLDRIRHITYPDNDALSYNYNRRNLLENITGGPSMFILSNLTYRASSQQKEIFYGNGVQTSYAYDSRLRLKEIFTRRSNNPQVSASSAQIPSELVHLSYDFDAANNITTIHDLRPGDDAPAGDKRRNTQIFQYDDLYRLTHAQFCFNLPAEPIRNDGEINYRYDRIGNMLAQTSTIEHVENGLSVTDLGQMDSGGPLGRSNRKSRKAGDPPGPHALSRISSIESTNTIRSYSYDANGNMEQIDGLTNIWDFKDRLIAVENAEMHADYTYDYTNRRITKSVAYNPKGENTVTRVGRPFTTSYINKYFEVRDHDEPVKYVWNGDTRVARVTGSLSDNLRVQRLRLYPGWNLVSTAVSVPFSQISNGKSEINAAIRWDSTSKTWLSIATALPAGAILGLYSTTNTSISLAGAYSNPEGHPPSPEGDFLPSAGLEIWDLKSSISNSHTVFVSAYDAAESQWIGLLPSPLTTASKLPQFISPGQAIFARPSSSVGLENPGPSLRVRYYNHDHLASSSVISDAAGNLVHQTTHYPFGLGRTSSELRGVRESYQFTQKEEDTESGLHYFESRYLRSAISRFTACDPQQNERLLSKRHNPQTLNPSSYCLSRPLTFVDPRGRDEKSYCEVNLSVKVGYEATVAGVGSKILGGINYNPGQSSSSSQMRGFFEVAQGPLNADIGVTMASQNFKLSSSAGVSVWKLGAEYSTSEAETLVNVSRDVYSLGAYAGLGAGISASVSVDQKGMTTLEGTGHLLIWELKCQIQGNPFAPDLPIHKEPIPRPN